MSGRVTDINCPANCNLPDQNHRRRYIAGLWLPLTYIKVVDVFRHIYTDNNTYLRGYCFWRVLIHVTEDVPFNLLLDTITYHSPPNAQVFLEPQERIINSTGAQIGRKYSVNFTLTHCTRAQHVNFKLLDEIVAIRDGLTVLSL